MSALGQPAPSISAVTTALTGTERALVVADARAWGQLCERMEHRALGWRRVPPVGLERRALDGLRRDLDGGDLVIGAGGGVAIDTAKYLGSVTGRRIIVVPTALTTLAPFVTEVVLRHRREPVLVAGDPATAIVLDPEILASAPLHLQRLGATAVIAAITALEDWRGEADPVEVLTDQVEAEVEGLLHHLAAGRGILDLAAVLARAGALIDRVGHRRAFEGGEHLFAIAAEHRLGQLTDRDRADAPDRLLYGHAIALGTVVMSVLQDGDTASILERLAAQGIRANPHRLGLDQPMFNGLLRHAVRFALAERASSTVLARRSIDRPLANELWRQVWRLER